MQPGRYGLVVSGLIRVDSDGVGGDGGLLVVVLVGPVHLLLVPVGSVGLGLPFPSRSSPGTGLLLPGVGTVRGVFSTCRQTHHHGRNGRQCDNALFISLFVCCDLSQPTGGYADFGIVRVSELSNIASWGLSVPCDLSQTG